MKLTNAELDEILDTAGLRMNQPYNPRGSYRKDEYIFTACKRCGTEAHYRLKCFCQSLSFMCGTVVFQPWQ
jgi:hypothetical protein